MAKSYQFVIKAIKAEFLHGGGVRVALSDMFSGNELEVVPFFGPVSSIKGKVRELAKARNVDAAWFVDMHDRSAKKPPGFKDASKVYHYQKDQQV